MTTRPACDMRRILPLALAFLIVVPAFARQAPDITYEVAWGAPNDHWLDITMRIGAVDGPFDLRIPYWRPGRYIIQNYAKDIVSVDARTADGHDLDEWKTDRNTWRVEPGDADEVVVTYRQWADQLDAGSSYVGQGRLSLNPVTAMMNIPGREMEPVAVRLDVPDGWTVATALDYHDPARGWIAADYHELVDSPFLASPDQVTHTAEVRGRTVEIVVLGDWEYDAERLVDHHRRIVEAQADIMQSLPFDRYVFLYQFLPYPSGHGVEHKNSTSIVLGPASAITMPDDLSDPGFYGAVLGVASHEFFHLWNVERIRPASMVPTDYSREQYTTQMWIYEGVTDYFGDLALLRAGLMTEDRFLRGLAGTVRSFDLDPGRDVTSVAMSSFDSWAKQDDPPPFTFYSFYTAGKALGMALDLEVRGRTQGERSLDDVMRYLYETYPMKGEGVPEDGFRRALESVTGTSFEVFFDAHVYGMQDVDWDAHLRHAGLRLQKRPNENRPVSLGVNLDGARITAVRPGSSAWRAGLDVDDVIVALDGESLDPTVYGFAEYAPGDSAELTVERYGEKRTVSVVLDASDPVWSIEAVDNATDLQLNIRRAWLASR